MIRSIVWCVLLSLTVVARADVEDPVQQATANQGISLSAADETVPQPPSAEPFAAEVVALPRPSETDALSGQATQEPGVSYPDDEPSVLETEDSGRQALAPLEVAATPVAPVAADTGQSTSKTAEQTAGQAPPSLPRLGEQFGLEDKQTDSADEPVQRRFRSGATVLPQSPSAGAPAHKPVPWYRNGFLSLGIVLLVISVAAMLFRRFVPSARMMNGEGLEVLGRSHLSPKQSLALVRVGRRVVLLGVTSERINSLCEIEDPIEVTEVLGKVPGVRRLGSSRFESILDDAGDAYDGLTSTPVAAAAGSSDKLAEAKGRVEGLLARLKTMQEQADHVAR